MTRTPLAVLAGAVVLGCGIGYAIVGCDAAAPDDIAVPMPAASGEPFDFAEYAEAITGTDRAEWQPASVYDLMLGPPPRIEEDEPGWNCATMGDRNCGPELPTDVFDELRSWVAAGGSPDYTLNADGTITGPQGVIIRLPR
ncbi:hypothetical protein PBI_THONKO_64 [Mycobacterium phage Thonko]|uniref:Lipoprotein n=1 Tax=Mycobacterium phage Thonko TaxID=2282910 RepID=A0A346FCB1_9CAUD|nr:hypothetical protein I5G57_gp064 [Mycobacterium phage Thonko]AXN53336.1 hypothetical protein PBI_THONKO_64 [Mycobacterium phage Thonko]